MDFSALINQLLIIGAVQGFIFIGVTFFMRKRIEKPVVFLNLFILFLSLNNMQSWVLESKFVKDPLGIFFTVPWYIMIVPMFYSFLVHYLEIERKRKSLIWLSSFLFVLALSIRTGLVVGVKNGAVATEVLQNYNVFEDSFALCYSILLYVFCIDILKRQRRLYPEILSYDNLKWVRRFLQLGGFIFILWGIAVFLNIFSETIKAPDSYYPLRLLSSILIYWVGYQGFFQYVILKERIALRKSFKKRTQSEEDGIKAEKGSRRKLQFEQLDDYILQNKSYLNPQLSLESLAKELDIGTSTLSKLVNENGIGFSEYINNTRVKEAQLILNNSDFNNYTIVAIGLECGFNSKSTFYSAFKKATGISPSEFRNK
jgi:AraC-like DNA-binding protein